MLKELLSLFAQSCLTLCHLMDCQHASLPCSSLSPGVWSHPSPLSQWCQPTISSSDTLFSFCPKSFPASGTFPMSWQFTSDDQDTGASVSASVLPMNIQDWFPIVLTCLSALLSKGLSRAFSNTAVQKHQLFGAHPSLWSNSHIHTWLAEKPQLWLDGLFSSGPEIQDDFVLRSLCNYIYKPPIFK